MSNDKIYQDPYPYKSPRLEARKQARDSKQRFQYSLLGIVDVGYIALTLLTANRFGQVDAGIIFLAMILFGAVSCCVGYWNFVILSKPKRR